MLEEEPRHVEEDEARMEEEICQEQEEEVTDAEMADEEEHSDPKPSAPMGRLIPRAPLLWPPLKMLSPPRRMPSSCSWHPNPKIQLLDLTAPGARLVRSRERWPSCA